MGKPFLMLCGAFALGSAFATPAYAADPKLDMAWDNLVKAEALLRAAEVPPKAKDNVRRAIDDIKDALRQIERAKAQGG